MDSDSRNSMHLPSCISNAVLILDSRDYLRAASCPAPASPREDARMRQARRVGCRGWLVRRHGVVLCGVEANVLHAFDVSVVGGLPNPPHAHSPTRATQDSHVSRYHLTASSRSAALAACHILYTEIAKQASCVWRMCHEWARTRQRRDIAAASR